MTRDLVFTGQRIDGCGRAHELSNIAQHDIFFNRRMVGTFNIKLNTDAVLDDPSRGDNDNWYWLVRIDNGVDMAYGWVYRWRGSKMPNHILEVVSRGQMPDSFNVGDLNVMVLHKWGRGEIARWVSQQYWFQTFPWSPTRADSALMRDVIRPACKWSGRTVLDVGAHYGYHSFWAAAAGASVVGFEPEAPSRCNAITIDRHIEHQGVEFVDSDPGGRFDVIMYLSVHHQIDPLYKHLRATIAGYAARCEDLFVELILPSTLPEFGGGQSDADVDATVGGTPLITYRHAVRGVRRIYHVRSY